MGGADGEELAEVACIGVTGERAVAAEEPCDGEQDGFFEGVRGTTRAVGATDMASLRGVVTGVLADTGSGAHPERQPQPGLALAPDRRGRSGAPLEQPECRIERAIWTDVPAIPCVS